MSASASSFDAAAPPKAPALARDPTKTKDDAAARLDASRQALRRALLAIAHPLPQPSLFADGIGKVGDRLLENAPKRVEPKALRRIAVKRARAIGPSEIAVLGAAALHLASGFDPPRLTTVAIPVVEIARRVVARALRQLDHGPGDEPGEVIPAPLQVGESTGRPASLRASRRLWCAARSSPTAGAGRRR